MSDKVSRVAEALQKPCRRARNEVARRRDVRFGMERRADGGAELVGHAPFEQKRNALADGGQVKVGDADRLAVAGGAVFDIHGDIVDRARLDERTEAVGARAVGIQLDAVAERADPFDKRQDVFLQKRLAARDADAVQPPDPLHEEGKKFRLGDGGLNALGEYKRGVVTEGATEVTATEEDGSRNAPGEIEKRQFLQSADVHGSSLSKWGVCCFHYIISLAVLQDAACRVIFDAVLCFYLMFTVQKTQKEHKMT